MEDQLLDSFDDPNLSKVTYAGFWQRFFASLIDGLLLSVVSFVLGLIIKSVFLRWDWAR